VIKRCPVCPEIRRHAEDVVTELSDDLGHKAKIEDGAKGEFRVLVDGVPVLQRNGDTRPTVLEVETAVEHAIAVPSGV